MTGTTIIRIPRIEGVRIHTYCDNTEFAELTVNGRRVYINGTHVHLLEVDGVFQAAYKTRQGALNDAIRQITGHLVV